MIFVTVGSQKFPFDRLIREIDQLKMEGIITEEVFAQIGSSTYQPKSFLYVSFMDQALFEEKLAACDLLITHGGTGVIVTALKLKKKIIAVPRLAKYGEHVDDHQIELLEQFQEQHFIDYCKEIDELKSQILTIHQKEFQPFSSNTAAYIEELGRELSNIQGKKKRKAKQVIQKYLEYATTKASILLKQKSFQENNETVHYLFEKNASATLVIVFSSCTRLGIKARYNYVKTLKNSACDKLFILDDWGYDQRGIYYLGKEMNFSMEQMIEHLIQQTIQKGNYKKIIFVGSSKGGYAALNFGLSVSGCTIIIGAPQYRLGDYLTDPSNKLEETLKYISGEKIDTLEEWKFTLLNEHLQKKIERNTLNAPTINIKIHYSDQEHTYQEHIKDLLHELQTNGYQLYEEVEHYTNHSDISLYFPDFLLSQLEQC